jgi:hypothetical protein
MTGVIYPPPHWHLVRVKVLDRTRVKLKKSKMVRHVRKCLQNTIMRLECGFRLEYFPTLGAPLSLPMTFYAINSKTTRQMRKM